MDVFCPICRSRRVWITGDRIESLDHGTNCTVLPMECDHGHKLNLMMRLHPSGAVIAVEPRRDPQFEMIVERI